MSEINVQKSRYFKVADLTEATGQPWAKSQLPVVIDRAEIGEYPAEDGKPAEDAFLVYFEGHEKPLGCNLTNRKVLAGIVGDDAEWDTQSLAGVPLWVYAESTSKGVGVRLKYRQPETPRGEEPPPPTDDDAPPPEDDGIPF